MSISRPLVALLAAAACALAAVPASAHYPGVVLNSRFATVRLDGIVGSDWAGAVGHDFNVSLPGGGSTRATLYVANDARYVYVGLRIARPALDRNRLGIWFDNQHDGASTPGQEDGISVDLTQLPGRFTDEYRCVTGWCRDLDDGGGNNGIVGAGNALGVSSYEIAKPFAIGDTAHDFLLRPGQVIGFTAIVETFGADNAKVTSCLPVCNILDPPNFGDIRLAVAPPPPPPPPPSPPAAAVRCAVPRVVGRTLAQARVAIFRASCRLGRRRAGLLAGEEGARDARRRRARGCG